MHKQTVLQGFCLLLLVTALLVPAAWSQSSTATLSGTVRDQTGAVIPDASISLTNTATNINVKTTTNPVGFYILPGLIPGPYRLSVEAAGMQRFEGALTMQVQQNAVVDPVLKVGQTVTEVTVQDVTPTLIVDSPTLGHVLERARIEQLPINGRSLTSLLQTVPGMEGSRAYGLREGSHEFVLDGAAMSLWNYGGTVTRLPGLDTIQEFKVENNNSSAKFTRPSNVIMSTKSGSNSIHGAAFETHRNNAIGRARRRQDGNESPQLIRNEFGISSGGPVYVPGLYNGKDKTFWFFAYEAERNLSPSTQEWPVPTEAMRNGDFSQLFDSQGRQYMLYNPWTTDPNTWARDQFAHNGKLNAINPNLISPLAKNLFDITPMPTEANINPVLDYNWKGPVPSTTRNWTASARIDHRFTENDQFYARYSQGNYNRFGQFYSQPMLNNVAGTVRRIAPNKSVAMSWVRTFSPTFFNEVNASVSREVWWKGTGEPGVKYSTELGLPNPFDVEGWPGLYSGGLYNNDYYFETDNTQASPFLFGILDDNATKIAGRHELQFGFHYRFDQLNLLPDQQQVQGNNSWSTGATALWDGNSRTNPQATPQTGYNTANLYLGIMNYSNQFVRGYFYTRAKEFAGYFQDNFKVTPRLTLNLGLRYEYWPALTEKNKALTSFDIDSHSVVLGQPLSELYRMGATFPAIVERLETLGAKFITWDQAGFDSQNMMNTPKGDFGPRLGFAYRMGEGAKSVVLRGGYRISYFRIPARSWQARMRSNPPLNARFRYSVTDASLTPDGIGNYAMRSVPTIIAGKNSQNAVTTNVTSGLNRGSANPSFFAKDQPDPRVQDWNFTLEKEVMRNTVLRATYVGNHGSSLEQFYHYNDAIQDYIWYVTTGTALPTGEYSSVARRPYDQTVYGGVEEFRHTGWSNYHGAQFEFERRYSQGYGFQVFYNVGNALAAGGQQWSGTSVIQQVENFMPGAVPTNVDERNQFLNYQRDTSIPKHRVRWNWIVDLPFGKGKPLGANAGGFLDRVIGGWQIAGMGSLRSTYFGLPSGIFPNGNAIETYGYDYPIEDCRSGTCRPGYLWWNGYIPANQINSTDPVTGKPNGVMGVPSNYQPAGQPIWPWPANPDKNNPLYSFYGGNTVWIPLKNGNVQRATFNDNLHGWRQQYLPSVRQWGLDASVFKTVSITEQMKVRLNADFFNVLNNPGNPNSVGSDGILSTRNSGQSARELQLTLRLIW